MALFPLAWINTIPQCGTLPFSLLCVSNLLANERHNQELRSCAESSHMEDFLQLEQNHKLTAVENASFAEPGPGNYSGYEAHCRVGVDHSAAMQRRGASCEATLEAEAG